MKFLHIEDWKLRLPEIGNLYASNLPYPHIVLDDFLLREAAGEAVRQFPEVKDAGWIHYVHFNEKKHGLNKMELLPEHIRAVINELNTTEFTHFLSELTGIPGLLADIQMEGGGLHQTQRGGFLNIHADFTVHPHNRNWRRRVNLLIYLNPEWKEEYGGHLELWDKDMSGCIQKISPVFNRAVIFNTDKDSFHGVPEPLNCPENMSRKSIALYYFTEEEVKPRLRSTNYRARPGDGKKKIWIWMDKKAIALYTGIKRTFGISDRFMSRVLNMFNRKKRG